MSQTSKFEVIDINSPTPTKANGHSAERSRATTASGKAASPAPHKLVMERVRQRLRSGLTKENVLLIALIVFMIVGAVMGVGLQSYSLTPRQIMYLDFPGYLFMRMLKMLILPLVASSIIAGLASLDMRSSGRIGGLSMAYYLVTTLLAVFLGIILAVSIRPGERGTSKEDIATVSSESSSRISVTEDKILDLIRNGFPDNLVTSTFEQTETVYTELKGCNVSSNSTECLKADQMTRGNDTIFFAFSVTTRKGGMNILGILVFCIAFGIMLSKMAERAKPLVDFFKALSEASMMLVGLVIWYSPLGICFLIAAKIAEMSDLVAVVEKLGYYVITVLAGLAIHGFVTLPLIYLVAVRKNPFAYMKGCLEALFTAFATASSSATLPVTIRNLEENNHVDNRVSRFVLPVGATINMDGTALYEAAAALFIAQLNGMNLSVGEIITTSVTATVASIGAAGVPSAGLVTMIIVLNAIGLPDTDVAYILAVDWLLDRFRTMINVWGDAAGAGIVQHFCQRQLQDGDAAAAAEAAATVPAVEQAKASENGPGETNSAFSQDEVDRF